MKIKKILLTQGKNYTVEIDYCTKIFKITLMSSFTAKIRGNFVHFHEIFLHFISMSAGITPITKNSALRSHFESISCSMEEATNWDELRLSLTRNQKGLHAH